MCQVSQDIMDKLVTTVKQFLDEGRMFTGYDVTIATRVREGMNLRHQDIRGAIHEIEQLNDAIDFGHDGPNGTIKWAKSQKDMPGSGWAFVYHPINLDPNQYQTKNNTTTNAIVAAPQIVINSISAVTSDSDATDSGGLQSDGTFATDYRDRLMIPTRFMREADIKAGENCFIGADANDKLIVISKVSPDQKYNVGTQKVEKNGELRLSSKTLKCAGLQIYMYIITNKVLAFYGNPVRVVEITGK